MSNRILGGRYEILEKIGEGGMAVVHKARCRLLNRMVALKILKPEFVNDTRVVESFRRESQSAASLTHPNIVNVYDVGKEGNIHYIVMEYIEGETLSEVIKREGTLDTDKAVSFAIQIASALGHAHKNHIIHRDVKPLNVLITAEGTAKITDFGIAKGVNSETIVNNNSVMGSVHYFSPEQARGGYIDEKSDLYSLGIMLYEMVTGKVPFDADNPVAVAMMHINNPIMPPSMVNPQVPIYVERVIMKATQKVQINRYITAQEMYDALAGQDVQGIVSGYFNQESKTDTLVMSPVSAKQKREVANEEEGHSEVVQENKKKTKGLIVTIGKKKIRIDAIRLSAIILAIIAAIFMSKGIFFFKDALVGKEVAVPRLLGMTYEQAETRLTELGLVCLPEEEVEQAFSDEYHEGEIMEQDPEQDAMVKKGFTVKFILSKGPDEMSVPNVLGKTLDEAVALLEERELEKGSVKNEKSEMPIGTVIRQTPESGTSLEKGATVDLVLSEGRAIEKVVVPDVIGKSVEEAKQALEDAGLKLGDREYDYSNNYAINQVYYQSIAGGQSADADTAISLKVSKGAGVSGDPKAFSFIPDYSEADNNVFTMRIYRAQNGGRDLVHEGVHSKASVGEAVTIEGSGKAKISVYYDDKLVMERNVDFEKSQFID